MGADVVNNNPTGEQSDSGGLSTEERITQLNVALKGAIVELERLCKNNLGQISVLVIVNLCLLIFAFCFGTSLYHYKDFGQYWTWQLIFFTTIRVVLVSGLASLIVFTVNLLRFYLGNYKSNRDKLFVAKSMASLIVAGSDFVERSQVYYRLLDIILANTSVVPDKSETIKLETVVSLIESLKETIKKQ